MSYEALSGLPEPYSMSVIVEAGKVVAIVVVVSEAAGVPYSWPEVDFGFLFCEPLVEVVLVLVEGAMDGEIKDEEDTGNRDVQGFYTFAFATWRDQK